MFNLPKDVILDKLYKHNAASFESLLISIGQIGKFLSAESIIIKANFAAGSYIGKNSHVVSDPVFLLNMVECIRSLNSQAKILIAESDSTHYGYAFLKFFNMGIDQWNIPGVTTLDLSRDILERVSSQSFRYFDKMERQLWISKTLLNADFLISTANLKSHSVTLFTGACKNLFGILPEMNKEKYHPRIHDVIHDLAHAVKVDLSIVDAFFGLEKNGPVRGDPINLGYRIFSNSPISADVASCNASGINYHNVRYLKLLFASKLPLTNIKIENEINAKIVLPTKWQRFFNVIGLTLQTIGRMIYVAGHKIHCAESPFGFTMILIKPILLIFFSIETLKRWKEKLFFQK